MPDTNTVRRLEAATERLEGAVEKAGVELARHAEMLRSKPCDRHEQSIQDLYRRHDNAKNALVGLLVFVVAGLLGVFFASIYASMVRNRAIDGPPASTERTTPK